MVVVIASNDCFVMAAWGKVNGKHLIEAYIEKFVPSQLPLGIDGDSKIKFMSDTKTQFSKQIDWMAGVGDRNARYAMIIEKDEIGRAHV